MLPILVAPFLLNVAVYVEPLAVAVNVILFLLELSVNELPGLY